MRNEKSNSTVPCGVDNIDWLHTADSSESNPRNKHSHRVPNSSEPTSESEQTPAQDISVFAEDVEPNFAALSDPSLLQYVEDNIYSDLVAWFDSEDYIVESVNAVYVSEEYLEEVAYNSKSNVYFGYTLKELDAQFEGTRYIFSLGENGETVVEEFAEYDDTYDRVIKNVAIGTGGLSLSASQFPWCPAVSVLLRL